MRNSLEVPHTLEEGVKTPLVLLKNSVAEFNAWRGEHLDEAIDFHGLDFTSSDLRDANLSRTNLRDADFRYSDLTNARLAGADLTGAQFRGAILTGIDIHLSTIENLDLKSTTITHEQFDEYIAALEKTITFINEK